MAKGKRIRGWDVSWWGGGGMIWDFETGWGGGLLGLLGVCSASRKTMGLGFAFGSGRSDAPHWQRWVSMERLGGPTPSVRGSLALILV